ncbi:beta-1,6-N-acetylglucosaminyltransferase [Tabrizicola sp. J26]|uniref:beta-1,6-N-acetylglucosaminyltransferase n=1 Tax=Alitabrizicola rongguiensis TaxID=2909234 RepID=UPI001F22EDE6|nr:beta-1,6-N-acetylglucosaminyltransferase [Tabrizicola rongguiensis]MCF1708290.1 beta-1,6-N-acetylglucosaminyltransferase [Tabrizicola rongguiensis]
MTVGFIMLCHTALDRAAQVARHLAERGCPVVIHVDRRTRRRPVHRLHEMLKGVPDIRFCRRHHCEWGGWGLVAATQTAAELMLKEFPQVRHVMLASGSCLPLRPVAELVDYLDARPHTDFIESVTTTDVGWTVGGLDEERFTLRFPFSWRKQRRLFDVYVKLQRHLGFHRNIPDGVIPHLGSQWWCLTRRTLSAILESPSRPEHDRYFRKVWIPDESYFQTLVRLYSDQVESRSLTLSKFDFQGKPHIFYDDHLQLLRRSDCFIARKIWPHAERLYATFLSDDIGGQPRAEPNPGKIDRLFAKAVERRTRGRPGLYMQSRFPGSGWEPSRTCSAYSVFEGFADVFENFDTWLGRAAGMRVHGHLFAADRAHFAGGETVYSGALSDGAGLRDRNPAAFLSSLIWNTRGERQCFLFGPRDVQTVSEIVAADVNAHVSVISGAWSIPLFKANLNFAEIRREAARLQKIELAHLDMLRRPQSKARVRVWTLAEFIENPMEPLQTIVDEISPRSLRRLTEVPRMTDLTGFGQFLQNLRNQGMQPVLMGDFPVGADGQPGDSRRGRPYLVR